MLGSSRRVLAACAGLYVLMASGCAGVRSPPTSEGSNQVPRPAAISGVRSEVQRPSCTAGRDPWAPTRHGTYTAVLRHAADLLSAPGGAPVRAHFTRIDENRYPTVFGVIGARLARGCRPTWYHVQLPIKPNGSTGWVRAASVRLFRIRTRIVVSLSDRTVTVYRDGRRVFRAAAAVGAPSTPTPVGRFYVNERFLLADANGPFGVAALGISAHSEVLTDWVQDGPIALHGTNDRSSIGRATSHGCVRLTNRDMARLFALTPAGAPVVIRR
jgi:lipoprotein-anchoring transpeptidase ErfK/SrfK